MSEAPRPLLTVAPRPARRRRLPAAWPLLLVVAMAALWSWQPSAPLDVPSGTVTSGLGVGELVEMPEIGTGATVRVDKVEPVWRCTGAWWEPKRSGVLFSGPVKRVTVTTSAVPDLVGVVPQDLWAALNVVGDAYTGGSACECDGSCETEPTVTPDGVRYTVLIFTGGTFSGLAFTPEPGKRYEWTL